MIDIERERERHRQREKQAPCQEPDVGLDPGTPGSRPGLKAGAKPLSHPGCPSRFTSYQLFFFKILFIHKRYRERGRDTGRGRSRLHAGSPMWDCPGTLGSCPEPKADTQPLNHTSAPEYILSLIHI